MAMACMSNVFRGETVKGLNKSAKSTEAEQCRLRLISCHEPGWEFLRPILERTCAAALRATP